MASPSGSPAPRASSSSSSSSQASPSLPSSSQASTVARAAAISDKRLFIGNLHPSVDEYCLVQAFTPHGHIVKLDIVFHKTGALKGKPRGYAFIEYAKTQEAVKAIRANDGRMLRGRELRVSFANANDHLDATGTGPHRKARVPVDVQKPTALSLVKKSQRPDGTDARIAAMEAKLANLRGKSSKEGQGASTTMATTTATKTSTLKGHPSLPKKPPTSQ